MSGQTDSSRADTGLHGGGLRACEDLPRSCVKMEAKFNLELCREPYFPHCSILLKPQAGAWSSVQSYEAILGAQSV
jgi:hypothetical protein